MEAMTIILTVKKDFVKIHLIVFKSKLQRMIQMSKVTNSNCFYIANPS